MGLMAGGAVLGFASACSGTKTEGGDERRGFGDTPPKPGDYRESPMLVEQVRAGKLPPVRERLPKEPFIVRPGFLVSEKYVPMEPGKYGGRLELPQEQPAFDPHVFLGNIEPLLAAPNGFDYDAGIVGNVLAGYEANDDDTVFVFHLRDGLKWSDGEPVTMEDVRFAFEDVLFHEELTPVFPTYLRPGLRADLPPAEFKVIDDLTFQLSFSEPYGTFPAQISIAQWRSYGDFIKPRHYLEQFHLKYASKSRLRELMREESIPDGQWFTLFTAKQMTSNVDVSNPQFLGHPTLTPWTMQKAASGVYTYVRNPYYFKIDMAGHQLPYIDEIRTQVVQDKETLTSRALFGEFDYLGERASLRQLPLIAEKAEKGDIKMHVARMHRLPISFALNLTYPDETWRKVVRDHRFRRALSMAINPEEILDNFYLGEFARPATQTRPEEGYDVEGANRLLDEMGMSERDQEGFRLGPDGKRFRIPFEIEDLSEDHIPMGELIAEYWKKVGVYTTVRPISPNVRSERQENNDILATSVWAHHDIWASAGWDDYLPETYWGPQWELWYTSGGELGEEPIPEVKELYEIHGRLMSARIGTAESKRAYQELLAHYRKYVWTFNPIEHSYYPTFWTSRVKNVPSGVKQEVFGIVVNIAMEQWYLDEG